MGERFHAGVLAWVCSVTDRALAREKKMFRRLKTLAGIGKGRVCCLSVVSGPEISLAPARMSAAAEGRCGPEMTKNNQSCFVSSLRNPQPSNKTTDVISFRLVSVAGCSSAAGRGRGGDSPLFVYRSVHFSRFNLILLTFRSYISIRFPTKFRRCPSVYLVFARKGISNSL